jgi:hypothetical protein
MNPGNDIKHIISLLAYRESLPCLLSLCRYKIILHRMARSLKVPSKLRGQGTELLAHGCRELLRTMVS